MTQTDEKKKGNYTLKTEKCESAPATYPTMFEAFKELNKKSITIGDLHANLLKLVEHLIHSNLVTMTPENYKKFADFYIKLEEKSNTLFLPEPVFSEKSAQRIEGALGLLTGMRLEGGLPSKSAIDKDQIYKERLADLENFNTHLQNMIFNKEAPKDFTFFLAGDTMFDRGPDCLLIAKVLRELEEFAYVEESLSNHNVGLISQYELGYSLINEEQSKSIRYSAVAKTYDPVLVTIPKGTTVTEEALQRYSKNKKRPVLINHEDESVISLYGCSIAEEKQGRFILGEWKETVLDEKIFSDIFKNQQKTILNYSDLTPKMRREIEKAHHPTGFETEEMANGIEDMYLRGKLIPYETGIDKDAQEVICIHPHAPNFPRVLEEAAILLGFKIDKEINTIKDLSILIHDINDEVSSILLGDDFERRKWLIEQMNTEGGPLFKILWQRKKDIKDVVDAVPVVNGKRTEEGIKSHMLGNIAKDIPISSVFGHDEKGRAIEGLSDVFDNIYNLDNERGEQSSQVKGNESVLISEDRNTPKPYLAKWIKETEHLSKNDTTKGKSGIFEQSKSLLGEIETYCKIHNNMGEASLKRVQKLRGDVLKNLLLKGELNFQTEIQSFVQTEILSFVKKESKKLFDSYDEEFKKLSTENSGQDPAAILRKMGLLSQEIQNYFSSRFSDDVSQEINDKNALQKKIQGYPKQIIEALYKEYIEELKKLPLKKVRTWDEWDEWEEAKLEQQIKELKKLLEKVNENIVYSFERMGQQIPEAIEHLRIEIELRMYRAKINAWDIKSSDPDSPAGVVSLKGMQEIFNSIQKYSDRKNLDETVKESIKNLKEEIKTFSEKKFLGPYEARYKKIMKNFDKDKNHRNALKNLELLSKVTQAQVIFSESENERKVKVKELQEKINNDHKKIFKDFSIPPEKTLFQKVGQKVGSVFSISKSEDSVSGKPGFLDYLKNKQEQYEAFLLTIEKEYGSLEKKIENVQSLKELEYLKGKVSTLRKDIEHYLLEMAHIDPYSDTTRTLQQKQKSLLELMGMLGQKGTSVTFHSKENFKVQEKKIPDPTFVHTPEMVKEQVEEHDEQKGSPKRRGAIITTKPESPK